MLFSSITFVGLFLPCILALYYIIPNKIYRNALLLFASLIFYAWGEPKFVLLMIASILFNYNMGILISKFSKARKGLLFFSVAANLGVLFVFKYLGFSCQIINALIEALHFEPLSRINLVLPIGISFYTFQEISYLVDVYKEPSCAQKNILNLGLYIAFFPQLIAGPIVKYSDINLQIENRKENLALFSEGLERFIIGLAKKVILANEFALVCDCIYDVKGYRPLLAWIAAISYALQIYYDFSGYSDMAIGLAKLFGFNLKENFNYPYAASSITDFWKRWHISLTSFFREYVYIPLGGNRKGSKRTVLNRFIVFFLTGLWHGAAFNFIFWGMFHGCAMVLERRSKINDSKNAIVKALHRTLTLFAVLFLWILFRNGTKKSVKIILSMFGINYRIFSFERPCFLDLPLSFYYIDKKFWVALAFGILFAFPWWRKVSLFNKECVLLKALKYAALLLLLILSLALLAGNTYNPFIYFRF
ncbi:MAG: MBOAT family protein [Treponema sp.]|nr:MBOAT family protein [Treponema sp.]